MKNEIIEIGSLNLYFFGQADRVCSIGGVSPTILTGSNRLGQEVLIYDDRDDG